MFRRQVKHVKSEAERIHPKSTSERRRTSFARFDNWEMGDFLSLRRGVKKVASSRIVNRCSKRIFRDARRKKGVIFLFHCCNEGQLWMTVWKKVDIWHSIFLFRTDGCLQERKKIFKKAFAAWEKNSSAGNNEVVVFLYFLSLYSIGYSLRSSLGYSRL